MWAEHEWRDTPSACGPSRRPRVQQILESGVRWREMGNAGGISSIGPSTTADGLNDGVGSGGQRVGDNQLKDLARSLDVSMTEIQVLWQRFVTLGPGEDGVLERAAFQKPPYSEDIFCRQIWKRFSGTKGAPHKISFESFAKSMIWWQKAPINYKLQLLFSWMRDVDGITPHVLSKILKHVLPSYQEDELTLIADKMIHAISPSADVLELYLSPLIPSSSPPLGWYIDCFGHICHNFTANPPMVKGEEFQQWMGQLPEEALRDALDFRILHIDAGTR